MTNMTLSTSPDTTTTTDVISHPSLESSEKSFASIDERQRKPKAFSEGHDGDLSSQFKGWMGLDEKSVDGALEFQSFQPKKWEETDVDIKITHCGLCGSDLHVLRSGWVDQTPILPRIFDKFQGPTEYPCCVGHEIVGEVVRVGTKVKKDIKFVPSPSCFELD